jgi:hypothetical protein
MEAQDASKLLEFRADNGFLRQSVHDLQLVNHNLGKMFTAEQSLHE